MWNASSCTSNEMYCTRHKLNNKKMNEELKQEIDTLIESDSIVLFMKGDKTMPMCGFSRHVCQILNELGVEYTSVNILESDDLRSGLKEYSQWPTFPQLYVNKEFIGGCDIVDEMYHSGELSELLNK